MTKRNILRIAILTFLVTACLSATLVASAYDYSGTCGKGIENYLGGSGSDWSLLEHYDIGSSFPYDDVYASANAGALVFNDRAGEYQLTASDGTTTGLKQSGFSFSSTGDGIQVLTFAGGIPGYDYATGHITSWYYHGHGVNRVLGRDARLDITN